MPEVSSHVGGEELGGGCGEVIRDFSDYRRGVFDPAKMDDLTRISIHRGSGSKQRRWPESTFKEGEEVPTRLLVCRDVIKATLKLTETVRRLTMILDHIAARKQIKQYPNGYESELNNAIKLLGYIPQDQEQWSDLLYALVENDDDIEEEEPDYDYWVNLTLSAAHNYARPYPNL